MFCGSCGKEINEGATFCPNCGAAIKPKSAATNTQPNGNFQQSFNAQQLMSGITSNPNLNIFGIIAGVILLLSAFLPFASISVFGSSMSVSLIDGGDGVIVIILALVGIVFSVLGKNIVVIVSGVISTLLFFVELAQMTSSYEDEFMNELASSMIHKGIGFYFLLIGAVCLIIAGIVGIRQKNSNIRR